jgi:hypothetical protein
MARGKPTKGFSARFSADVVDALESHSVRTGQSKTQVAERLIDEGLRLDQFPGIMFRSGPTGRRAGVVGGPDVWEIVRDLKGVAKEGTEDPVGAVARVTGLDHHKIELALNYYAAYPHDIDERIRMSDEAASRAQRVLGAASVA